MEKRKEAENAPLTVQSGETQLINAKRFGKAWYGTLDEERVDWDDFVETSSMKTFLKSLNFVPLYKYLVNYTYYWFYGKQLQGEASSETIEDLVKRITKEFKANGMPAAKAKASAVREMLTTEWSREWDNFENASTWRVFDLAFGLNLPVTDVEELLKKAVKRAGFNYYDKKELLAFCVICGQEDNRYDCFKALERDFDAIEPVKDKKYIEKRDNTEAVRKDLEASIEGAIYKDDVFQFENLNAGLKFFLAKYKAETIESRTAANVFQELYEEVVEKYSEDILAFKKAYRSSEESAEAVLEITYNADREITIPKGTKFYAVKKTKDETKRIEFVSKKEEVLPKQDKVDIKIPICSVESHVVEKNKKAMPCYIGNGKKMTLQTSEAFTLEGIKTSKEVSYKEKEGEEGYAKGAVSAKVMPGTMIPEGTVFLYGGKEYRSTENIEVSAKAVTEISVVSTLPNKPGEEVTAKNTIQNMGKNISGIYEITNPKRVVMKEVTNTISKELFREFLYRYNTEDIEAAQKEEIEDLIGTWFTETEITSVRFSVIQAQSDEEEEKKEKKKPSRKTMEKNEVRRSDIITLAFMSYCYDILEDEDDGSVETLKEVYRDFVREVNKYLKKCRMMPFYLTNPYERFLAFLLKTEEPVDSLRNTWEIVRAREEAAK